VHSRRFVPVAAIVVALLGPGHAAAQTQTQTQTQTQAALTTQDLENILVIGSRVGERVAGLLRH